MEKVMLSLCYILNQSISWKWVLSFMPHFFLGGKSAWYTLNMILCVPQCQCGCLGEEKNFNPAETRTLIPCLSSPQPRCYTAKLFWFPEWLWTMPQRI